MWYYIICALITDLHTSLHKDCATATSCVGGGGGGGGGGGRICLCSFIINLAFSAFLLWVVMTFLAASVPEVVRVGEAAELMP